MSNELRTTQAGSVTMYAMVRDQDDKVWYPTGQAFEVYGTTSRTANDYAIALTSQSGDLYTADFPSAIDPGTYDALYYSQAGALPADTPTDTNTDSSVIKWAGSAVAVTVDETTATTICNIALLKLGENTISSIVDGSEVAGLCLTIYARIRNEVLSRIGRTSFGDLGAQLAGSSLIEAAEWLYQFDLPSDNLRVLRQTDEQDSSVEYPFSIKRQTFLTNTLSNGDEDSAYVEYVHLNENTATYSPMETEAVATLLAAELAPTIKGKAEFRERLLSEYELDALPGARVEAGSEEFYKNEEGVPTWRDARLS